MERSATIFIILGLFLIIGVFMTGCSDSSDQTAAGSTSETITAMTTTGPLYTAGDIVRSSTGSTSPAWLVVSYDSADDSYTRAFIYKNNDGSYGYRMSPATDTVKRIVMEKVYTVKITHVTVSSVPTAAPTTVTTEESTMTTTITTAAVTTTMTSTARPSIKAMNPEEGEAGTTVLTEIKGSDFMSNLTAMLRHSGETSIKATTVTWSSSSSVTCMFDLPNTTKAGSWDIVVTNPNGLSGEFTNYFEIHGNKTGAVQD
jgi:hypothetical protein